MLLQIAIAGRHSNSSLQDYRYVKSIPVNSNPVYQFPVNLVLVSEMMDYCEIRTCVGSQPLHGCDDAHQGFRNDLRTYHS